jgi:single-strand DNA-binding protein
MNILHLCGFLGADPEEKYTPNGQKLWELRVATRSYKNGQEETIWWRLTSWGDQYDNMLKHFKKGKPIYVVAEMNKLGTYTDKSGQAQVSYEATVRSIHFLPMSDRQDGDQQQQNTGTQQQSPQQSYGGGAPQQQQPPQQSYGGGAPQQQQDFGGNNPMQSAGAPTQGVATNTSNQFPAEEDTVPF